MHEMVCEQAVHNGLLLVPYETPVVIVNVVYIHVSITTAVVG